MERVVLESEESLGRSACRVLVVLTVLRWVRPVLRGPGLEQRGLPGPAERFQVSKVKPAQQERRVRQVPAVIQVFQVLTERTVKRDILVQVAHLAQLVKPDHLEQRALLEQLVLPEHPDSPGRLDRPEQVMVREVQLEQLEPVDRQDCPVIRGFRVTVVNLDSLDLMERLDRWVLLVIPERARRPDRRE